jgi:hypothetical protein
MASFLSKFISGAAKAGGTLLADQARQNQLADLQAKRDAVLEANREKAAEAQRTAVSVENEKSRAASAVEAEKSRAASAVEAEKSRTASAVEAEKGRKATSREHKLDRAQQVQLAKIKENPQYSNPKVDTAQVNSLFKSLRLEVEDNDLDESVTETYDKAYKTVAKRMGVKLPDSGDDDSTDPEFDTIRMSEVTDSDRANMARHPVTGKIIIRRGDKWLEIIK